jgi:hypothetical protein
VIAASGVGVIIIHLVYAPLVYAPLVYAMFQKTREFFHRPRGENLHGRDSVLEKPKLEKTKLKRARRARARFRASESSFARLGGPPPWRATRQGAPSLKGGGVAWDAIKTREDSNAKDPRVIGGVRPSSLNGRTEAGPLSKSEPHRLNRDATRHRDAKRRVGRGGIV